ncbi:MAG: hypothetical protein HQ581_26365 [Planctomycetes bacterium]|nr:hypothetical protein [Planctomycetota bacterium]
MRAFLTVMAILSLGAVLAPTGVAAERFCDGCGAADCGGSACDTAGGCSDGLVCVTDAEPCRGCGQCSARCRRTHCNRLRWQHLQATGQFNCQCRGSYKFPVLPQYTYHWPGMYSQRTMTEYVSPYRFPPLTPPEEVFLSPPPTQPAAAKPTAYRLVDFQVEQPSGLALPVSPGGPDSTRSLRRY